MHAAFLKKNRLGLTLIALTWLIFFWRVLFGGQAYFLDDLKILYYPIEFAYAQAQNALALPAWSPYFGFGHPLLAWGQLGFFTPLHLLLRLFQLHPINLLNISIIAYIILGAVGMYSFLRHRSLNQFSASLGAIVFAFCGFTIGHLNHVNFYTATMLLPWLLLAISHFIAKPTLPKTALLAIAASIIPLSGQPQVSLYTFVIATLYGLILFFSQGKLLITHYSLRITTLTLLAALLTFSLSSFAILPLREFLPVSDRSGDLPTDELYEFSYPPTHAITLLFPYYFGDHELYWGAKNFQELAAYVGVLPLPLALLALFSWRKNLAVRITGLLLVAIAFILAPGIYSPIYRFLVENHLLASLTVPGRFVYFFDVGVAILAAVGLEMLLTVFQDASRRRESLLIEIKKSMKNASRKTVSSSIGVTLVALTAANLIWWGWNYNPLTDRTTATTPSPFTATLQQYEKTPGVPARLYASETIPLAGLTAVATEPAEPIGPLFTVHQPVRVQPNVSCLTIPFTLTTEALTSTATLSLSDRINHPPFFSYALNSSDIAASPLQRFCPPELQTKASRDIVITLASNEPTSIQTLQRLPVADEQGALYVRVPNPTKQQLERSRKIARLVVTQDQTARPDLEKDLLVRHIQTMAHASSARWAGALGISNFRAFIQMAFADDRDPIDGEGIHALVRHRNLVDMSGITHLAQSLPVSAKDRDSVLANGYPLVQAVERDQTLLRLYANPQAFPKAYLVGAAIWESGPDQTRHGLSDSAYDGRSLVYISGPTPPQTGTIPNPEKIDYLRFSRRVFEQSQASIIRYDPTRVEIAVAASEGAWLVLTDAATPQWQTFIDGVAAPQYIANSVFRAAQVPAGSHTVVFEYRSPAIQQAKWLTTIGLLVTAACLLPWLLGRKLQRTAAALPGDQR